MLIEHQTKIDEDMPYRLLDYSNEIMRSAVEDKNYNNRPCVIPIVLYTGKRKWNIENNKKENQNLYREINVIIEEVSGNMMAVMEMLIAENEKYINIGRQEGKMQKLKEIVQKMLAENFSKDTIVKITGLKKEEIEKLK